MNTIRPVNTIRPGNQRGHADHGWLESFHSFSFADYFDPEHVEFGPLRVINEDRVAPGGGFGTHPHRDGRLAHRDSMGNGSEIRPGDVQRMSAGSGVRHSEFNASSEETVHFLQIWIQPDVQGIPPSYEEKHFPDEEKRGRLRLIASPNGAAGSVSIHQDVHLYAGLFDGAERAVHALGQDRRSYVHLARGAALINGVHLLAGDALKVTAAPEVTVERGEGAEVLLFDLPGEAEVRGVTRSP
jgi:redox-sensitive bicupin YhaK (pirin superfamily)